MAKVARGVAAAHDLGVVHRDLEPGNILLDAAGGPKVADFGLAKRSAGADLTRTGVVMGTPAYMAPEQASGRSKFVGPPADVWAVGVILYECLTGGRPFAAADPHAVVRQVIDDEPERPSRRVAGVPRDPELICLKCLSMDPAERYPTAGEPADELDRFLAGEPVRVRPAGLLERGYTWARRKPYQAATAAAVLLAVGLGSVGTGVAALGREAATHGETQKARKELAGRDDLQTVNLAGRALAVADYAQARRRLDDCDPEFRASWEWAFLDRQVFDVVFAPTGPCPADRARG